MYHIDSFLPLALPHDAGGVRLPYEVPEKPERLWEPVQPVRQRHPPRLHWELELSNGFFHHRTVHGVRYQNDVCDLGSGFSVSPAGPRL